MKKQKSPAKPENSCAPRSRAGEDPMRATVVQFAPTADAAENRQAITRFVEQAAGEGARFVLFPERSMLLPNRDTIPRFRELVAEHWPPFLALVTELAATHDLTIVAGGFEPAGATGAGGAGSAGETPHPLNTLIAVGPAGEIARYRKLHVYDAFAYSESDYTTAGDELPPVIEVDGVRIGLANCYDVRFPELFRSLVDRGAEVIAHAAAWVAGPGKEAHWTTLTTARAIESVSWVLASGTSDRSTVGLSRVVDPLGNTLAGLGPTGDGMLTVEVDPEVTAAARETLPALANRRIALTYEVRDLA